MNLLEIYNAFEEIKSVSGRNEKEIVLAGYIGDELFQDFLQIMYNPYIVTGLGKKSLDMIYSRQFSNAFININELFDYLKSHSNHKQSSLLKINHTLDYLTISFGKEEKLDIEDFLVEVVTKTYSCGLGVKSFNKVVGYEFIPVHEVMLAKPYDSKRAFKQLQQTGICFITLKLDGVRATLVKNGESIVWLTRSGNTYEGLQELTESAKLLPDGIYDGEILYNDITGQMSNDEVRRSTTSIMNSKNNHNKTGVKYVIFDIVDDGNNEYKLRRAYLSTIIYPENIELLPLIKHITKK